MQNNWYAECLIVTVYTPHRVFVLRKFLISDKKHHLFYIDKKRQDFISLRVRIKTTVFYFTVCSVPNKK